MADLKDLAKQYGLEDYEQLLGGYPNAEKFLTGLKDAAVRAVPTTEQMRDPNFIIDAAGLGGAIKAYHGTPHLFDRFDMSKIGTGEGAQAYGHGLYFAENPLVAESYRKNLSKDADVIYQAELNGVPIDIRDLKGAPNLALASLVTDPSRSIDDIIKIYREGDHSKPYARLWPDVADFLDKNRDNIKIYDEPIKQTGNLYETSIRWPNAEREEMDPLGEHHLLDWDQPVEGYVGKAIPRKIQELQNARDAISSKYDNGEFNPDDLFANTYNFPSREDQIAMEKIAEEINMYKNMSPAFEKGAEGSVTYHKLAKMLGSPEKAAEYLHSIDIPGIKYLDATSRSTDKGTRNYVMFGDEYPEITKRAGNLDELKEKYAQGGIVKAQDQNENLGKLAEMLGSARDVGNQYTVPSWVPLAGGVGAGDLLMGKTPEEIENWSYGNAPMQIPEMSNVPQFKRGRAQSLADALTTLAPGVKATEGLPAGLSFIGPKSRNWDKVAAELAAKKLDEGADPAEVWREHLIGRMPDKTLFSEISDKEMSHVIPLNKWVNRENGQFMAPNISTAWDEAASTLTPNAPVRIKRLFEHDQLKNEYPYGFTKNYENQSIMDMPVFMQEKNSKSYGSLGDGDLTLNPSLLPKEARSTVLHELQHAIQNQEGWGKGGSPAEFELSDFSKSYWQNIYDKSNDQQSELLQSLLEKKKAGEIDNNDIRLQMESLANRNGRSIAETMLRRDKNPIESYKRLAGEAQARATQDRLDMDMAQRRENYPLAGGKLSDIPLEDLIYKYEGNGPSLAIKALKLHHGSNEFVPKIKREGLYDAIFATPDRHAALSHGDKISNYYVNENKIGHDFGDKYDETMNLLRRHYPEASEDDIENILYPAIAEDVTPWNMNHEEVMRVTGIPDMAESSWKLQADRGRIGKALGYDAVKVRDEHGDSYMIPFESKAKYRAGSLDELQDKYYEGNGPSLSMDPLSKYKDYVGEHSAPLGDSGAPLHDLTANENAIYPSDVYSSQANQYYGTGEPEDAQLFAMAQRLKDKPNEKVSIYRAVPKMQSNSEKIAGLEKDLANYMKRGRMPKNADFDNKSDWYEWASNERDRLASLPEETIEPLSINHGDWVALDKKYAKEHGESALGGNYKILSKKVPARQLFTNGDSIREWGWDSRYAEGGSVDKDSLQLDKPQRTPNHPTKSHIVKTMVDGKEKVIRFGEQGAETAGKPKEGESDRMTAKRESFKARHAKNIAKGKSSAAYWADKVKWAEGGEVDTCYAEGGSVVGDLPFDDTDQLRLYHQAMQHFDDLMENTGGSKKMGKTEARINYNTTTKGDRDRDKDLHTLIADYGVDVGKGVNLNATMIKPMEAEGVYLGNLTGSVPVGEGRASLGLQGLHTKYSDGLSGYTAGYNGKVGDGNLSASYFEPADHNSAGRQVQLEYSMPFADGGSVSEFEDPAHERLYRRAMAHFDDMREKQNFEDNDSMIASTILHPVEAAKRYGKHLNDMYAIATDQLTDAELAAAKDAGYDEESYPLYAMEHPIFRTDAQKAQAGMEFAGLAQTGAMPFAPEISPATLGSINSPKSQLGKIGATREKKVITEPEEGLKLGQRISTANPTAIAAEQMGFHSTPEYIINSEIMRSNPEAFEKNMKLMAEYMPSRKRSTDARFEDYKNYISDNLSYLAKQSQDDFFKRSGNWYKGANALANDMSNAYDIPIEASAGVLARLSPGMDWMQNVEQADRLADIWRNHQNTIMPSGEFKGTKLQDMPDSSAKAAWIRSFDEQTTPGHFYGLTPEGGLTEIQRTLKGEPKSLMWQSNANLLRAVNMLEDSSIENISKNMGLSGHKIRNFYNNIADPFHPEDITIDTHAVSAGLLTPYSQKGIPVGHAFGGGAIPGVVEGSAKSGMASGMYGLYADAYRDAAKKAEVIPQSMQSPTWELIRENFPTSGVQKDKLREEIEKRVLNDLKKGNISPEMARESIIDITTKGKGFKYPDWYK